MNKDSRKYFKKWLRIYHIYPYKHLWMVKRLAAR
jgi:hypothetical protein